MRVHEAIVAVLKDVGVDVIFGGAGEESMGMQIAVAQAEGVRGIIPKHEQNASFMACGYALFSGKLGVCFSTAGPGAFNLLSGVCVALNGSLPLIAITGYATMAYDGRGQANETSGLVRTPDSRMVWDAVVKKDPTTGKPANYLITKLEDVVPIMHKAVEVALTGRPGPVQVAVAWNITAPTFQVTNYSPPRIDRRPVAPNPAEIESAAAFLAQAIGAGKRTVLWAGYGAIRAGAGPEVRAFMERYQVPLVTTMDGKGIVAEDHPLAMGLFCNSGHKSASEVFLEFGRGGRARQLLLSVRHIRLPPGPVREPQARLHQRRPGGERQVLQGGLRHRRRRQACHGGAAQGAGRPRRAGYAQIVPRGRFRPRRGRWTG